MCLTLFQKIRCFRSIKIIVPRLYSSTKCESTNPSKNKFETVFSFPTVKYIALINRMKVHHLIGTSIVVPSTAALAVMNIVSSDTCLATIYVGLTGAVVLSLATLPFRNVIGHLYISEDNKEIKISFLNFWGKRIDRIVGVDDWIPLLEMKPKPTDALYLTPKLADGTTLILPVKFGKVLNSQKMGQVLE